AGGGHQPRGRPRLPSSHKLIIGDGTCVPSVWYSDGTIVPSLQEGLMRVFITGGTGLIGSAVVAELLANGHTVLALTRSDASTRSAESAGAETIRGGLADLNTLRTGARQSDGVIHLAFANDFSSP